MRSLVKLLPALLLVMTSNLSAAKVVAMQGQSPLVTLRIVFLTGAAHDPKDKPGAAGLTAAMLADGGTRQRTYKQIVDALFPMATRVSVTVDKEMTAFSATTHLDNLDAFYAILREMLLDPGWREDDLKRVKDDIVNYLRVGLRDNNDEELGKEVLYNEIYAGHPYGWHSAGTVSSVQALTMADLKSFYTARYTQANLILGIAGGYPPEFLKRIEKDFQKLPKGKSQPVKLPEPKAIEENRLTIVEKPARSVAMSIGFPIEVRRGHPDYPALLLAQSYFGQHRMSAGRLFERIRQIRGINYGDYAYIEYFPRGMFQFEPDPNIARRQQIFEIWIRPVEPPVAHFTLRLALYELDRLVRTGLTTEEFEQTRNFLSKNVNLLTRTKNAELGYTIDSGFYNIPDYNSYVKNGLAALTVEKVNEAIRRHLRTDRLQIVLVGPDAQGLKKAIVENMPSPMTYNSPKPDEILAEDKVVEKWKIPVRPEAVRILPVDTVFE